MLGNKKKIKKASYQELLASVKKEMDEPRVVESARIKTKRQDAAMAKAAVKA